MVFNLMREATRSQQWDWTVSVEQMCEKLWDVIQPCSGSEVRLVHTQVSFMRTDRKVSDCVEELQMVVATEWNSLFVLRSKLSLISHSTNELDSDFLLLSSSLVSFL